MTFSKRPTAKKQKTWAKGWDFTTTHKNMFFSQVRSSSSSSEVRQKFVRSSSEVRQVRQKFVRFVRSSSSSSEVRQVRQISFFNNKIYKLFGHPKNQKTKDVLPIKIKKISCPDSQLGPPPRPPTNLTNVWRTWRTFDELRTWRTSDELDEFLTNFWRTSDELLTNLTNFWDLKRNLVI